LAKRHEVFVFYRINDPKRYEYSLIHRRFENLETYAINRTFKFCSSFSETYNNDIVNRKFTRILEAIKPDIVHIHHLLFLSCGIVDEIKKRKIPILYVLHDYWLICYRGQLLKDDLTICSGSSIEACRDCLKYILSIRKGSMYIYQLLKRRIPGQSMNLLKRLHLAIRKSDGTGEVIKWRNSLSDASSNIDLFIAPSNFIKDRFSLANFPKEKILYCPYGFDNSSFANGYFKKKSHLLRFGYMGTLLPSKGVDILISVFKKIKNSNVRLSIYGKLFSYAGFEFYPQTLQKLAYGDDRIQLAGEYDNKDIGKIFSEIDVLLVPSIWQENAPLVIQESFLAKTPVIASRIGGIPELINDRINGLLFEPGNVDDLKEKMQYVIDNPAIIEEFRKNIPRVKSIEDNAAEMEHIYSKLIARENICA
jgi:glycosyltransferase involved in cell wall biosynthesis